MTSTTGVRLPQTVLVTYLFAVVMTGTTLPTPLYAVYSQQLGLSPLIVTVIYAVYAVGVLGTLLLLGRLSDHIGRRPVLVAAVLTSALSALVFAGTAAHPALPILLVGRLVSGVSAGLVTGAATAYLSELEGRRSGPGRAAELSTVANMGGLGLGPLLAGVLAEHVPHPTLVPYLAGLVLLLPVALVGLLRVPETVTDADGWRAGIRPQRIGVPAQIRVPFAAAALAGLAAFALLGFVTALAGQVLSEGLGDRSHQTAGVVPFLLLAAAAVAQLLAGRTTSRRASLIGLAVLPVGVAAIVVAVVASLLPVLVAGVLVAGLGVGFAFRGGLAGVTALAPEERRGEVISTFFVAAYVGLTVPVVAAGVLVTTTSLRTATVALAVFVAALAAVAATIVSRSDPA